MIAGMAVERVGGGGRPDTAAGFLPDRGAPGWMACLLAGGVALGLGLLRLLWNDEVAGAGWLDDPLGRTMLVLALLPWPVAVALGDIDHGVGRVVAAAGSAVACLADGVFPALLGFGCTMLAAPSPRRGSYDLIVPAMILGVAWFGTVILSTVSGAAPIWSGLLAHRDPGSSMKAGYDEAGTLMLGVALLGAFWWAAATSGPARTAGRSPRTVRSGMVGSVAACLLLRMLALPWAAGLGAAMRAAGCAVLVWTLLVAATDRRRSDVTRTAVTVLAATVLLGFATGTGAGVLGGMLALFSLGVAVPLARCGGTGWRGRSASMILAALPPFAPFAALLLVLERLFVSSMAAAVLLLCAATVAPARILMSRHGIRASDTELESHRGLAVMRVLLLLLLLLGGLLLPPPIANWLLQFVPPAPDLAH